MCKTGTWDVEITQHFVKLHFIILNLKNSQFMAGSNTRVKGLTFKLLAPEMMQLVEQGSGK